MGKTQLECTDYSSRCWNGMLSDYYLGRWDLYLKMIANDLDGKVPSRNALWTWKKPWKKEFEWAQSNSPKFQSKPGGDVFMRSKELFGKYLETLR